MQMISSILGQDILYVGIQIKAFLKFLPRLLRIKKPTVLRLCILAICNFDIRLAR